MLRAIDPDFATEFHKFIQKYGAIICKSVDLLRFTSDNLDLRTRHYHKKIIKPLNCKISLEFIFLLQGYRSLESFTLYCLSFFLYLQFCSSKYLCIWFFPNINLTLSEAQT